MSSYIYKDIKDKIRKSSMKVILETPQTYNLCVFPLQFVHLHVICMFFACKFVARILSGIN